jgi:hypothetical protein
MTPPLSLEEWQTTGDLTHLRQPSDRSAKQTALVFTLESIPTLLLTLSTRISLLAQVHRHLYRSPPPALHIPRTRPQPPSLCHAKVRLHLFEVPSRQAKRMQTFPRSLSWQNHSLLSPTSPPGNGRGKLPSVVVSTTQRRCRRRVVLVLLGSRRNPGRSFNLKMAVIPASALHPFLEDLEASVIELPLPMLPRSEGQTLLRITLSASYSIGSLPQQKR